MNSAESRQPRLWPGMVLAVLQVVLWFVVARIPEMELWGLLGTAVAALGIVLWWVFFSRVPWLERLGQLVWIAVAVIGLSRLGHVSLLEAGQGRLFYIYGFLLASFSLAAGSAISAWFAPSARRGVMAAAVLLGCAALLLFRSEGIKGAGAQFVWRWTPTAEERLLAQGGARPALPPPAAPAAQAPIASGAAAQPAPSAGPAGSKPAPAQTSGETKAIPAPSAAEAEAEWPGFRGPHRDGVVHGVRIQSDWAASRPVEMWRRAVGPGWSSFAVRGELIYTQEQRGEDEMVACYNLATGAPVWEHRDAARFWEANAGAGPRGTPTLHGDRVYTFGATGILNALNAANGAVLWSRNVGVDTERKTPYWGFSSSPLVVEDAVIVAASGRLAAYDTATGKPRWMGPTGASSYSSPQLLTIDGVAQIVLQNSKGVSAFAPGDGKLLWEHAWEGGSTIVQPAGVGDGDILVTAVAATGGLGTRRLAITHENGGWRAAERWTSAGLKPYFNDMVIHQGHAYGFDGNILSCIRLEDGQRTWKGGRYGNGQMILLADADLLLVLSEDGDLALVKAAPDQFTEVAKIPAIEGKTWNHPVMVGNVLLIRNDREMAAFRLPTVDKTHSAKLP